VTFVVDRAPRGSRKNTFTDNVVQGNWGCRSGGDRVGETAGRRDDGSLAAPHRNLLVDNASYPTCRGH
jgi:hypothetical protein